MHKPLIAFASAAIVLWQVMAAAASPLDDGSIEVNRCDSLRLEDSCEPEPLSAGSQAREKRIKGNRVEVKRKLVLSTQGDDDAENQCLANFEMSYHQVNEEVSVETEVRNDDCVASHGAFAVRIRTIDQSGEPVTQSFTENWSRDDEKTVQLRKRYPIPGAQRLVWARVKANAKTACRCD